MYPCRIRERGGGGGGGGVGRESTRRLDGLRACSLDFGQTSPGPGQLMYTCSVFVYHYSGGMYLELHTNTSKLMYIFLKIIQLRDCNNYNKLKYNAIYTCSFLDQESFTILMFF